LLTVFLSLGFVFGVSVMVVAETPKEMEATIPVEKVDEPVVKGTPTSESPKVYGSPTLTEADLKILGEKLQKTGKYLRETGNVSGVPVFTLKLMDKMIEKDKEGEGLLMAGIIGVIFLPAEVALSATYGGFAVPYYFGRSGDQLVEASKVFPPQEAFLMKRAGDNLKDCRKWGFISSALFCGGLLSTIGKWYSKEDDKSLTYESIAMSTGYGLRLLSTHYADLSGKELQKISESPLSNEPLKAMGEAGKELQDYRKYTCWGTGLEALGMTMAVAGKDTVKTVGILTTLGGWIIAHPIAGSCIKSAAQKLDEAGDRMIHWKMSLQERDGEFEPMVIVGFDF
ncbi:MAG: hypothetical protein AAB267_06385, partial [Candidatus Desantisbacteria bacterium]